MKPLLEAALEIQRLFDSWSWKFCIMDDGVARKDERGRVR